MSHLFTLYFRFLFFPFQAHNKKEFLSFTEGIVLAWPWIIIQEIISVILWQNYFGIPYILPFYMSAYFVIFFPLLLRFEYVLWEYFLKFFGKILGKELPIESVRNAISSTSSSYPFRLIPIFGALVQRCAFALLLFAGMRETLGLSRRQGIFALVLPFFLLGGGIVFPIIFLIWVF